MKRIVSFTKIVHPQKISKDIRSTGKEKATIMTHKFIFSFLFLAALLNSSSSLAWTYSGLPVQEGSLNDQLVHHLYYNLLYSEEHEQARWVSYELKEEHLKLCTKRTNSDFTSDPMVTTGSASSDDYQGSGQSKGHLIPAGDRSFKREAMRETFYFSNMSPQSTAYNGGIWMHLEHLVRAWAIKYGQVHVITGPVLEPGLQTIGRNRVSVPHSYYKIIAREIGPNKFVSIAFLIPNSAARGNMLNYIVSVKQVEDSVGFSFFNEVVDEKSKTAVDTSAWDLLAKKRDIPCK